MKAYLIGRFSTISNNIALRPQINCLRAIFNSTL
nr:MAG TPA: hypothetical protein [Caudoviricetes sp.]